MRERVVWSAVVRAIRHWWRGRPYAPWFVVGWLGRRDVWCWASLVAWKCCNGSWPSRNTRCVVVMSKDEGVTCYCGFWDHERCEANRRAMPDKPHGATSPARDATPLDNSNAAVDAIRVRVTP